MSSRMLLMFVPYSIRHMNSAPSVRAYNLYEELRKEIDVTFLAGRTLERTLREMKYISKAKKIYYVYIEAMSMPLSRIDYMFLKWLRKHNALLFPFIRDLYWKYPGTLSPRSAKEQRWIESWFRKCEFEMNWYLNNATALLFPSRAMANTIDFSDKYELPPGGDPCRCKCPDLPPNKNMVFAGEFSPKTGITTLLTAMKFIIKEYPDAHCTVVGSGNPFITNKWKRNKWVTFATGNYWNMPSIMSNAYVATIPWVTHLVHNNITIPLKLFDYMSFGRPVVATNCKVMADFIRSNDVGIVTEDSPEHFAEGILELFNNRVKAEKMGRNAISAVQKEHSWKDRAKKLIAIIEKYA